MTQAPFLRCRSERHAAFSIAPSGRTPRVAYFHSVMRSLARQRHDQHFLHAALAVRQAFAKPARQRTPGLYSAATAKLVPPERCASGCCRPC